MPCRTASLMSQYKMNPTMAGPATTARKPVKMVPKLPSVAANTGVAFHPVDIPVIWCSSLLHAW